METANVKADAAPRTCCAADASTNTEKDVQAHGSETQPRHQDLHHHHHYHIVVMAPSL